MTSNIKAIAINLPQFHPFAENNEWWGEGFTEWSNVAKAKPLFDGHYQPHLPADLGFYDLRLEEARIAQAQLAKQYGIKGFCYYHYWFNGKRLMNAPLDAIVESGKPDFPFMMCWANENWTRRWDGHDNEVLIKQDYSHADDVAHIRFLIKTFFNDPRYIRVNNKPFFLIYRPAMFPDIKQTVDTWRKEASAQGLELYLGYMNSFSYNQQTGSESGFDCSVDFQPQVWSNPVRRIFPFKYKIKKRLGLGKSAHYFNEVRLYADYVDYMIAKEFVYEPTIYPGISPGWDNTARRTQDAVIFVDSTPDQYGRWLQHVVDQYKGRDTFLFINAWNEWAEGNHLEPCQKWGTQYLEQTVKILNNA